MARNISINGNKNNKKEDRTKYKCYGNSDYIDFWYINRLNDIGRFGLDFDNGAKNEDEEALYNDLSEYIDKNDFINMLHLLTNFELENPNTWNRK